MLRKQKIKKICFILFTLILICFLFKYRKIIAIVISRYYFAVNLIIGIIIGTICFVVAYYTFLYLGRIINALVDWVSNMASKMDAVVIVAFITGTVSIVGVIISSVVAKIIDYRKSRQDYM